MGGGSGCCHCSCIPSILPVLSIPSWKPQRRRKRRRINMSCPPVRLCSTTSPLPNFLALRSTLCTWVRAGKLRQRGRDQAEWEGPHRGEGPGFTSSPSVWPGAGWGGLSWQSLRPLGWAERDGGREGGGERKDEWEGVTSLEGQCNHGNSGKAGGLPGSLGPGDPPPRSLYNLE